MRKFFKVFVSILKSKSAWGIILLVAGALVIAGCAWLALDKPQVMNFLGIDPEANTFFGSAALQTSVLLAIGAGLLGSFLALAGYALHSSK